MPMGITRAAVDTRTQKVRHFTEEEFLEEVRVDGNFHKFLEKYGCPFDFRKKFWKEDGLVTGPVGRPQSEISNIIAYLPHGRLNL